MDNTHDLLNEMKKLSEKFDSAVSTLSKEIVSLKSTIAKDKIYDTWIAESIAAKMIGMEGRTLRRKAVSQQIKIHYRNNNGRAFQYKKQDLIRYQTLTSTSVQ